jgi:hypothetical protein
VGHFVVNMTAVKERDQHADVEERDRDHSSSSSQRLTAAFVMSGAPGR